MTTTIGDRLAHIRGSRSQADFARELGVHKNSLGNYERGDRTPDANFLGKLINVGFNANWVITGEGPMLLKDLDEPRGPVDMEILEGILTGLAEIEELEGEPMEPNWRARMTAALYEYFIEEEAEGADIKQDIGKVIKLIRKAG